MISPHHSHPTNGVGPANSHVPILQWCTVFDERATLGMPYSLNRVHTILTNRAHLIVQLPVDIVYAYFI